MVSFSHEKCNKRGVAILTAPEADMKINSVTHNE